MKKMRLIALVLALAMILCVPAVAAETVVEGAKADATIVAAGASAVFKENGDMVTVTVESASLKAGSQYVILMVKSADGEKYTIDAGSILYIDQAAASASGSNGKVTFDVYPSDMTNGVILIAGADSGLVKVAIIKGKWMLGDVDNSGEVDVGDVTMLLKYLAKLADESEINMAAANVDGSEAVDVGDATLLLKVLAGLASL